MNLKRTVKDVLGCQGCPLRALYPDNTFVEPQETASNRVAVGEAPGADEASEGKPFCGGAGKWLKFIYGKAGVNKDSVNIINTIQCRPPDNIYPTDPDAKVYISKEDGRKAVQHCLKAHVWPFLKGRRWSRVDLFGGKALEFIAGKKEGIYTWRGSPLALPELGDDRLVALGTLHPAALMRDQSMLPVVVNDLRKGLNPPPEHYNLHPSLDDVQAFTAKFFSLDIETAYWSGKSKKITLVGLSDRLYHAMVVPFHPPYIAELRRIVLNAEEIITQNGLQFDMPILCEALDIEWKPQY